MFASTHLDPDAVQKQKDEIDFRAWGKQRRYSWDYDETFDIFSSKPDGSDNPPADQGRLRRRRLVLARRQAHRVLLDARRVSGRQTPGDRRGSNRTRRISARST